MFREKPYQGQAPEKAKVIIVGLDAKYIKDLANYNKAFELVKEYHIDPIGFWEGDHKDDKGVQVHHPFLDENYTASKSQGGVRYHKNFRKALALNNEYKEEYAECICFFELSNVPTFGNTIDSEFWDIFVQHRAEGHARWLDSIITCKSADRKLVLLCEKVMGYMRVIKKEYDGVFYWIPDGPVCDDWHCTVGNKKVHKRKSFSPTAATTDEYLKETGRLIIDFCKNGSTTSTNEQD